MEQNICQKCGTIVDTDSDWNKYYGFCSMDCYYTYMSEYDKEKLSFQYWDWS